MTYDTFKLIHSELIQWVQYIEHDLKIIYSLLKKGNYDDNSSYIDNKPLGKILRELHIVDTERHYSRFAESDYELLDEVRNIRNYWCHRGYVDFHYVRDPEEHERAFQEVAEQLHHDEICVYGLYKKIEKLRINLEQKYEKRS